MHQEEEEKEGRERKERVEKESMREIEIGEEKESKLTTNMTLFSSHTNN